MKRFFFLLFIFISCQTNVKNDISLSEINVTEVVEDLECKKAMEWWPTMEEAFQMFIDILKQNYNQKYTQIVLCNFRHSGETVSLNSLAIFHNREGYMTVLSFGKDWNTVRKEIKVPSISTEKILSKLSEDGNFTKIIMLDITKNNSKCHFLKDFNYDDYKRLQDLSFFNQ